MIRYSVFIPYSWSRILMLKKYVLEVLDEKSDWGPYVS